MSLPREDGRWVEELRREWAAAPPEPDLRTYFTPEARGNERLVLDLVRCDALERFRCTGQPASIERYESMTGPISPATDLARGLVRIRLSQIFRVAPQDLGQAAEQLRRRFPLEVEAAMADLPVINTDAETAPAPARAQAEPAPVPHPARKNIYARGDVVGPYTLREPLGRGGFGEVWLAEQENPRRQVALKLIRKDRVDSDSLTRFAVERQALAMLDHECIARIYDAGCTADNLPYFAMEYVQGEKITSYCDRHRLSLVQRLELFARVCDGVHHAHTQGLIHRDLSPDNILVEVDDQERPRPKIIDFGVAKATNPSMLLTEKTLAIEMYMLIGKIEYMSPEQAEAGRLGVDTRTDIHALGVILYELLTGVLPIDRSRLSGKSLSEMLAILRYDPRPDPAVRFSRLDETTRLTLAFARGVGPAQLRRELGTRLRHLPMTAIGADRTARFNSADVMRQDIDNFLHGRDFIITGPEPWFDWLARKARRNKGLVAGAALLLLAATVSTAFGVLERRARHQAERAQAVTAQVRRYVNEDVLSGSWTVEEFGPETAIGKVIEAAASALDSGSLADEPFIEAEMRLTIADSFFVFGENERAEREFNRASELFAGSDDEALRGRLRAAAGLWGVYLRGDRKDEARSVVEQALSDAWSLAGMDDPAYMAALQARANSLKHDRKIDEAERLYREILARRLRDLKPTDPDVFVVRYNLALTDLERAKASWTKPETARRLLDRTLAAMRQIASDERSARLPPTHRLILEVDSEIAGVLFRRALLDHPEAARLALLRRPEGIDEMRAALAEARAQYDDVLDRMRRRHGGAYWRFCEVLANFARLRQFSGELQAAADLTLEALQGYEKFPGPAAGNTIELRERLAECRAALGDADSAAELRRENVELTRGTLASLEAAHGASAPQAIAARDRLARCQYAAGDRAGARQLLRKGYDLLRDGGAPAHDLRERAALARDLCRRCDDAEEEKFWAARAEPAGPAGREQGEDGRRRSNGGGT